MEKKITIKKNNDFTYIIKNNEYSLNLVLYRMNCIYLNLNNKKIDINLNKNNCFYNEDNKIYNNLDEIFSKKYRGIKNYFYNIDSNDINNKFNNQTLLFNIYRFNKGTLKKKILKI